MIAQIDEQQLPVIALPMHPAGEFDGLANMEGAKRIAMMGAVGMHGFLASERQGIAFKYQGVVI
jgi:hypothetical protein